MKLGKISPDTLTALLERITTTDPRVILGPRLGEDAALIDYGDKVLVAKTDPITFATDLIGWYAVQVNANDVACAGAKPRWFLATLLLPQTISDDQISSIFDQIVQACNSLDISLVGGHTEISHGLDHPIVVGCMLGEVSKDSIVTTSGATPGDSLVITKGIALEGSSILAREKASLLLKAGVSQSTLDRAREYLFSPGINVVREALTACSTVDVHSLHDPTEGGLATGLWEVAKAANVGINIQEEKIPITLECATICDSLGLDPLGLLASGALIITLPRNQVSKLRHTLKMDGIQSWEIGAVVETPLDVTLSGKHCHRLMPTFERDELARFFDCN